MSTLLDISEIPFHGVTQLRHTVPEGQFVRLSELEPPLLLPIAQADDPYVITRDGIPLMGLPVRPAQLSFESSTNQLEITVEIK